MFEIQSNFGARIGASRAEVDGFVSFDQQRRATVEQGLMANKAAVQQVGRRLESGLSDDIARAGLAAARGRIGEALYSVQVFPKRGLAYNPAVLVAPAGKRAADILEGWELGGKITRSDGGYMPVPLPNAIGLLGNGRASRKELYQRAVRRFGDPKILPLKNGNLLVLLPLTVTRGGRIGTGSRRAVGGASRTLREDASFVPMFVLVREVQLRARTRARAIIAEAEREFPQTLAAELAKAWA